MKQIKFLVARTILRLQGRGVSAGYYWG